MRLWVPYCPEPHAYTVPAGEVVEVSAAEAMQICRAGGGEIVGPPVEVAAVVPRAHAVRGKHKGKPKYARR